MSEELKHRIAIIVGMGLPFLLAICLTQRVPVGKSVEGSIERPALAFSTYQNHIGQVSATGTIPVRFEFCNRGDGPVEIVELKPSCGCLAPKMMDNIKTLQPNQWGRFFATINTANETPGDKDYTIDVKYRADKELHHQTVRLQLIVPERKVTVVPSELYFYQLSGKPDSRTIKVQDHRGTQLTVLDAQLNSDLASVELGKGHATENGVWETNVRVDVAGVVPNGRKIAMMTLTTDDPDYPQIKLPILIQGPTGNIVPASGTRIENSRSVVPAAGERAVSERPAMKQPLELLEPIPEKNSE